MQPMWLEIFLFVLCSSSCDHGEGIPRQQNSWTQSRPQDQTGFLCCPSGVSKAAGGFPGIASLHRPHPTAQEKKKKKARFSLIEATVLQHPS